MNKLEKAELLELRADLLNKALKKALGQVTPKDTTTWSKTLKTALLKDDELSLS